MIETEQQRRWWFATHPEYSHSRAGRRGREQEGKNEKSERVSAAEVDRYVDDTLKHETGTLAEFLKIVKKWFGTEGEERESDHWNGSGWDTVAGGGARVPPPPPRGGGIRGSLGLFDGLPMLRAQRRSAEIIERELGRAGANRRDYRLSSFSGLHIAERDGLFRREQRDPQGRTNVQRMKEGRAPLDRNGEEVRLHHANQDSEGPIIEMTRAEHASIPIRRDASGINRNDFGNFRATYWMARAASIRSPQPRLHYLK